MRGRYSLCPRLSLVGWLGVIAVSASARPGPDSIGEGSCVFSCQPCAARRGSGWFRLRHVGPFNVGLTLSGALCCKASRRANA